MTDEKLNELERVVEDWPWQCREATLQLIAEIRRLRAANEAAGGETHVLFNMNRFVKIRLTPVGLAVHRKQHDELNKFVDGALPAYSPPSVDERGYTREQLWIVMQTYGPHISMGKPMPFETEIVLCAERAAAEAAKGAKP
jgi:hypothetical protein